LVEPCLVTRPSRLFDGAMIEFAEGPSACGVQFAGIAPSGLGTRELFNGFLPLMEGEVTASARVVDDAIAQVAQIVLFVFDLAHLSANARAVTARVMQRKEVCLAHRALESAGRTAELLNEPRTLVELRALPARDDPRAYT